MYLKDLLLSICRRFFHPNRRPIRRRIVRSSPLQYRDFRLESRVVPAWFFWDGGGNSDLASDAYNWDGDTLPGQYDTLVFDGNESNDDAVFDTAFNSAASSVIIQDN